MNNLDKAGGGLLDELSRQAEEIKTKEAEEASREEARARERVRELSTRLQALQRYFKTLRDNLVVLKPDLSVDYDVPRLGRLSNLKQCDYILHNPEPFEKVPKLSFEVVYAADQRLQGEIAERPIAQQHKNMYWNHKLRFTTKEQGSGRTIFNLEARVPVSFTFLAVPERGQIRLTIRNLDKLGVTTNHLDPEDVNQELADELAKCILHKPNRLKELTGDNLSNTGLHRIRDKLNTLRAETQLPPPEPEEEPKGSRWGLRRRR